MSEFVVSQFWQYVKPGDWRTCDSCHVTQPVAKTVEVERGGRVMHFCTDVKWCLAQQERGR